MIPEIDTIIWDWNGTLLNDTDLCILSINPLLAERNLPAIKLDQYLDLFDFPVIDYYRKLGFNFELEPFEIPALQFIRNYSNGFFSCRLHDGAQPILHFFKEKKGFRQFILSAMELDKLNSAISMFKIDSFFEAVSGLGNDYASSKVENGKRLFHQFQINPQKTCLIGDTLHDWEVANTLGCLSILIANGHQSKERLCRNHNLVVDSICDLFDIFEEQTVVR
jgi:phosphoglycolate phosphatase